MLMARASRRVAERLDLCACVHCCLAAGDDDLTVYQRRSANVNGILISVTHCVQRQGAQGEGQGLSFSLWAAAFHVHCL